MPLDPAEIRNVAEGYTAAWCSRSAEAVAAYFAEDAKSIINDGEPSVGRATIAAAMEAFFADQSYDLVVIFVHRGLFVIVSRIG